MKVSLIHPTSFKLDGGAMFGIIPKPLWSKKIKPDDLNRIEMSLRVVFIETENKKILTDTAIGDYHPDKFNQQFEIKNTDSPLLNILNNEFNIAADEVTDVILTHLHFDHVGGLGSGKDGKTPLFPNATIHLHQDHLEYAKNPTLRDRGSFQSHFFLPLLDYYQNKSAVNFVNGDEGIILSDGDKKIQFKTSHGHTPYMIHPIFGDYIYMADLVPMSHHIKLPWVMGYDIEPGVTTIFKKKFYDDIIKKNLIMIFEHDTKIWGGRVGINEKSQYYLTQEYKSNQLYVETILEKNED